MKISDISAEDSIEQNLNTWCFEVGSVFEQYSIKSAHRFLPYIKKKPVIDLGAGDGAATKVFIENGNKVTAVDINQSKLDKIQGGTVVKEDFLTFLSKPVDSIFFHHALEHFSKPQKVLDAIGKHLKKGCYAYIAVPKGDTPHSVHHVAFESVEELVPSNTEIIESGEVSTGEWPEYWVIVRKV